MKMVWAITDDDRDQPQLVPIEGEPPYDTNQYVHVTERYLKEFQRTQAKYFALLDEMPEVVPNYGEWLRRCDEARPPRGPTSSTGILSAPLPFEVGERAGFTG